MATDFRQLLSRVASEVERPQPLPPGTYTAVVKSFEPVESGQKKTPGIKVTCQLVAPTEDVDLDQLEQVGGLAAVQKRKVSTTYWLTEDSQFRLREFLEVACKLPVEGRSFAELLPETANVEVLCAVKHRITDKQEILLDLDQILPAA